VTLDCWLTCGKFEHEQQLTKCSHFMHIMAVGMAYYLMGPLVVSLRNLSGIREMNVMKEY
jgi:hypothetical protein